MFRNLFIIVAVFALVACKNNTKTADPSASEADVKLKGFIEQSAEIFPAPKSATDVALLIAMSGAKYDPNLHNDVTRAESYLTDPILAAANCGVYTADVVYHTIYESHDSAFSSLTGAKILALEMGFGPLYIENVIKRYEDGITEEDSILYRLDEVLAQTELQLNDSERLSVMTAYLTGNFVEKQYILHKMLQQSLDNVEKEKLNKLLLKEFLVIVLNQQKSFSELVEFFEQYSLPDSPGVFLRELKIAEALYKKLFAEANPDEMYLDDLINNENLVNLRNQIYRMRNMIVESTVDSNE